MRFCRYFFTAVAAIPAMSAQLPSGRSMTALAIVADTAHHRFYAVDTDHDALLEIDAVTRASRSIPVGHRPIALALDAEAARIYVVDAGSGDLAVVDTVQRQVIARPKTDSHPYAIAVDTALHRVYVSNTFSNKVTVYDASTGITEQLPLGSKDALLCDPVRHRLYMTSYEDTTVAVLDELAGTVTRLPAMNHLWGMALNENTGDLQVTSIGAGVLLRLAADVPPRTVRTGYLPAAVAMDGETAVVTNAGDGSVALVRGTSVQVVYVSPYPQALAVDPEHHRAYVVDAHAGTVTTLDLAAGRVIESQQAGFRPYAIALDPHENALILANLSMDGSPAYTVLPLSNLP